MHSGINAAFFRRINMANIISYDRYQRQVILKNFGEAGQRKLLQAKVLVIGAGGLGCAALQYLAAAGTGKIGIVDDDVVSLSNLNRQVLFSVKDIGCNKAEKATRVLQELNPEINIIAYPERLTTQNALTIIQAYDIIIDGTDNFSTRYLVNDACVLMDKPFVYGAVSQYEGQVGVFNFRQSENVEPVNYRDIFPIQPAEDEVLNCAEAGVLGVLPGIIGNMQANETIKLITGIGTPLINRLLTYNSLNNQVYEVELSAKKETRSLIPKDKNEFLSMDYGWLCVGIPDPFEIDCIVFDELLLNGDLEIIDVREPNELPVIHEFVHHRIPLNQVGENSSAIISEMVVTICQTGKRSREAAKQLSTIFGASKKIYSLQGGILNWKKYHTKELL